MADRYFQNNYADYNGETSQNLNSHITQWIEHQTHKLEQHINQTDLSDASVYTGTAGKKNLLDLFVL